MSKINYGNLFKNVQQVQKVQSNKTNIDDNSNAKSFNALEKNFKLWSDFFHTNGYIILTNAIEQNKISKLRTEIAQQESKSNFRYNNKNIDKERHQVHKCFFENSPTTIELIDSSILYDFAEQLAGTCVLINNQLWHRGSANTSEVPRETLQLTFARRIIGHKHKTIMNYHMP